MQQTILNLTGKKYGSLKVAKYVGPGRNGSSLYKCQCSYCGKVTTLSSWDLVSGKAHCQCMTTDSLKKCLAGIVSSIPLDMNGDRRIFKDAARKTWTNAAYDLSEYYEESRCAL